MSAQNEFELENGGRRNFLGVVAIGGPAVAASLSTGGAAAAPAAGGAESAFRRAFARSPDGALDAAARLSFLAPDASVIDHDVPYPMDVAGYADHLRFLASHWEKVDWSIHDLRVVDHGKTAVVSCFYSERGKPRDGGFRLRPGFCTALCVEDPKGWSAVALHMSPLTSQILDASPS